mmetsp:Transcript_46179/g.142385  ORF Transcript_46179/g.142385 Transcript_46179/m.142385 type:complete len:272 (-) Transcript_46179:1606-2421(-)
MRAKSEKCRTYSSSSSSSSSSRSPSSSSNSSSSSSESKSPSSSSPSSSSSSSRSEKPAPSSSSKDMSEPISGTSSSSESSSRDGGTTAPASTSSARCGSSAMQSRRAYCDTISCTAPGFAATCAAAAASSVAESSVTTGLGMCSGTMRLTAAATSASDAPFAAPSSERFTAQTTLRPSWNSFRNTRAPTRSGLRPSRWRRRTCTLRRPETYWAAPMTSDAVMAELLRLPAPPAKMPDGWNPFSRMMQRPNALRKAAAVGITGRESAWHRAV